jgi:Ca-activated chloride channel family protein
VTGSGSAEQVRMSAGLAHPVLKANEKQITHLKVGLTGFRFAAERERTPVNVALVIDRSGSMTGDKIAKAKEAAIQVIYRLGPNDIVSVVAYDQAVQVLVPATKLTDKGPAILAVRSLEAGGSTALFSGVSRGAEEVRKFLDRSRVNRVILLSDGIANVGPSSPAELGDLGGSLIKEGISVTTIGLGLDYHEDLLTRLAERSDGNHYFAERPGDLDRVFRSELGDVLSVVAQEVVVKIECAEGIRPVRLLGREGDITGRTASVYLNQLYSEQEKYVLLEVEIPPGPDGAVRQVASITVTYANMQTKTTDTLRSELSARHSAAASLVEASVNREVAIAAVEQIAALNSLNAVRLRDQGKTTEARALLEENRRILGENGIKYNSEKLKDYSREQEKGARSIENDWPKAKKSIEENRVKIQRQKQ